MNFWEALWQRILTWSSRESLAVIRIPNSFLTRATQNFLWSNIYCCFFLNCLLKRDLSGCALRKLCYRTAEIAFTIFLLVFWLLSPFSDAIGYSFVGIVCKIYFDFTKEPKNISYHIIYIYNKYIYIYIYIYYIYIY